MLDPEQPRRPAADLTLPGAACILTPENPGAETMQRT